MVICLNYRHFENKLRSVIVSQIYYINQILDVHPLSFLRASEKIFNLQIYVCGMLKHFLKLCSKKPHKSSPEFSRLCGRPPLPSGGGGPSGPVH